MPYPRLLNLGEDLENELKIYIREEIIRYRAEIGDFDDQLVNWQNDYDATPSPEDKGFPFRGACKIVIPLTAIAVEMGHASAMQSIYGLEDQILSIKPKIPEAAEPTTIFERFANEQLLTQMKLKSKLESTLLELRKFGTGIAKTEYCSLTKWGVREEGGVEVEFPVQVKNSVEIKSVSISRFAMRLTEQDAQMAPWCGEVHLQSEYEIALHERDGLYAEGTVEKLKSFYLMGVDSQSTDFTRNQEEIENRVPTIPNRTEIWEMWLSFHVSGDTEPPKEIQAFYHFDSQNILSVFYNQKKNLRRPYNHANYFKVEHRWMGIGVCKQNDQFQLEVTVQHRQRIDNATIANLRMFKVARLSGYGPKEPIFPGKFWILDDMDDIEPMQLGEIYPSSFSNEQQTLMYSQQRVGTNELTLGMPQQGTPGTATADITRLQEARKREDYVVENCKELILDTSLDALDLLAQYGARHSAYMINTRDAELVDYVLKNSGESFRSGDYFDIRVISAGNNRVLDRQNWQQIGAQTVQYYTSMIQLAQGMGDPRLVQMLSMKALTGGTEAFKQFLDTFNIQNVEKIAPMAELQQYLQMLQAQGAQAQVQSQAQPAQISSGGA